MTDGQREKIKLKATYFNGVAIALIAVGGIGPYVALNQIWRGPEPVKLLVILSTVLFALGFIWLSLKTHDYAARILDRLDA